MQDYFGRVAALLLCDLATWKRVVEVDTAGLFTRWGEGVEAREEHQGSGRGTERQNERESEIEGK